MTPATPTTQNSPGSTSRAHYPQVLNFQVTFGTHNQYPKLSVLFNNLYTIVIPFNNFMLKDGSNWLESKTIIDDVRAAIVSELTTEAVRTADKSIIPPLIQRAGLLAHNSVLPFDSPACSLCLPSRSPGTCQSLQPRLPVPDGKQTPPFRGRQWHSKILC